MNVVSYWMVVVGVDAGTQGAFDCFKRVLANEGALSLWRGNLTNVIRYIPTQVSAVQQLHGCGLRTASLIQWFSVVKL